MVELQPVIVFVKVKFTVPEDNPLTIPELVTVATALLLLLHVPPVPGDNVIVLPTHTEAGAETTGNGFTFTRTLCESEQPVAVIVSTIV